MSIQIETPTMQHDTSGSGEPLVLVPGGLTGWLSWLPHAEALAASRRVARLQLLNVERGLSGGSLPPTYSVEYEVAALGRTLDELGIKQADFAGWSYGALISLSYALRHPDRVRSLTLIEPPAYWVLRTRGPLPERLVDEEAAMKAFSTGDVSEEQLSWFTHFAGFVPEEVDPRTLPQWPVWVKHRQSLRIGDHPFRHADDLDLVRAFEKPVLLVQGEEGPMRPEHDIIAVLAEEFPAARVVAFPGWHAPHIVSMQPFMDAFTRFLAERQMST